MLVQISRQTYSTFPAVISRPIINICRFRPVPLSFVSPLSLCIAAANAIVAVFGAEWAVGSFLLCALECHMAAVMKIGINDFFIISIE